MDQPAITTILIATDSAITLPGNLPHSEWDSFIFSLTKRRADFILHRTEGADSCIQHMGKPEHFYIGFAPNDDMRNAWKPVKLAY